MTNIVFAGDKFETIDLLVALDHQCKTVTEDGEHCTFDANNVRTKTCKAHQAMLTDQRFLDGVLTMRHLKERLQAEEFKPPDPEIRLLPYRGLHTACGCGCGRYY